MSSCICSNIEAEQDFITARSCSIRLSRAFVRRRNLSLHHDIRQQQTEQDVKVQCNTSRQSVGLHHMRQTWVLKVVMHMHASPTAPSNAIDRVSNSCWFTICKERSTVQCSCVSSCLEGRHWQFCDCSRRDKLGVSCNALLNPSPARLSFFRRDANK